MDVEEGMLITLTESGLRADVWCDVVLQQSVCSFPSRAFDSVLVIEQQELNPDSIIHFPARRHMGPVAVAHHDEHDGQDNQGSYEKRRG